MAIGEIKVHLSAKKTIWFKPIFLYFRLLVLLGCNPDYASKMVVKYGMKVEVLK